jgi:hypothetical protein
MKDSSDRNGLEVTETISVAGSVAGSILAMASQQLIYAAAPLTLALGGQPTKDGKVQLWTSSQAFADFYPVIPYTVTSILGFDGWQEMEKPEIEGFVAKLNQLFESFEQRKFEFN